MGAGNEARSLLDSKRLENCMWMWNRPEMEISVGKGDV